MKRVCIASCLSIHLTAFAVTVENGGGQGFHDSSGLWSGDGGGVSNGGAGNGGGTGNFQQGAIGKQGKGGKGADDGNVSGGIGGNPGKLGSDNIHGEYGKVGHGMGMHYGGGGGGGGVAFYSVTEDYHSLKNKKFLGGAGGNGGSGKLGQGAGGGGGAGMFFHGNKLILDSVDITGGVGGIGALSGGSGGGLIFHGKYLEVKGSNIFGGPANIGQRASLGDAGVGMIISSNKSEINLLKDSQIIGGEAYHDSKSGHAIIVSGNSNIILNQGIIHGGTGGMKAVKTKTGYGLLITGHGNKFVNEGTLEDGGTMSKPASVNAVLIQGNNNQIEFHAGTDLKGLFRSTGNNNRIIISGVKDWIFKPIQETEDLVNFSGFSSYHKNDKNKVNITYSPIEDSPWFINEGVLVLEGKSDFSLVNGITVDGTLDISTASAKDIAFKRLLSTKETGDLLLGDKNLNITYGQGGDDFKGSISGTGSVNIFGHQIFSGNNNYTGNTIITKDSHLQLGTSGTSGSIISDIINNGELIINRSNVFSYAGKMSGSGIFTHLGSGQTVLSGDNSLFTGSSSIQNGTLIINGPFGGTMNILKGRLQLGTNGTSGSIISDIINNGELIINRSNVFSYAGKMSGSGIFTHLGSGQTVLSGDNSLFTGSSSIQNGTLIINGPFGGTMNILKGRLQLGTNGTSGSIISDIVNNGELIINRSNVFSYAGKMSGSGIFTHLGSGQTVLSGDNSLFTGSSSIQNGTLIINGPFGGTMNILKGRLQLGTNGTSGSIISDIINNGELIINRSNVFSYAGKMSGSGIFTHLGSGQTVLSGDNSLFTGSSSIQNGTLIINGPFGGTMNILKGRLQGFGTIGNTTNNTGGILAPDNGVGQFGTLTIKGSYEGKGGEVEIHTQLDGDNSPTDQLAITGNTSGSSKVRVIKHPDSKGAKTKKGIKIINVGGKSSGTFELIGDYHTKDNQHVIVAGSYAYALQKGTESNSVDGNWYLRSRKTNSGHKEGNVIPVEPYHRESDVEPIFGAHVPVYEAYTSTLQSLNTLSTLQERVSNRYVSSNMTWGRIVGEHHRLRPASATDLKQNINIIRLQIGFDRSLFENTAGQMIAGLTGQYGLAKSKIASFPGDGKINTHAWGIGTTLTWYDINGFYVDGQAQGQLYNSDLYSIDARKDLAKGNKSFGYALGLETGQHFVLSEQWSLIPQAQLIWSSVKFDDFRDIFDSDITGKKNGKLTARFGLAAEYSKSKQDKGNQRIYTTANLYQTLSGRSNHINISTTDFTTHEVATWGGVGVGGNYSWGDDNKYTLYGEGSINRALEKKSTENANMKGTIGFRIKW